MSTLTATTQSSTTIPNAGLGANSPYRTPKKWTKEKCITEASKHDSISKWAKASDSSYRSAKRYNWMDVCTAHMTKYPDWNPDKCRQKVAEFKTIGEWKSECSESFRYARDTSEKLLADCKKIIAKNNNRTANRKWTKEAVIKEARKYSTVTDWHANGGGSYRKAKLMKEDGWWDEATAHMSTPERTKKPYKWTLSRCKKVAKMYSKKSYWLKHSPSSYLAAERYGYMEECTSHMKSTSDLH